MLTGPFTFPSPYSTHKSQSFKTLKAQLELGAFAMVKQDFVPPKRHLFEVPSVVLNRSAAYAAPHFFDVPTPLIPSVTTRSHSIQCQCLLPFTIPKNNIQ